MWPVHAVSKSLILRTRRVLAKHNRLEAGGRMVLTQPSAATVARTLADTEAASPTAVANRYS